MTALGNSVKSVWPAGLELARVTLRAELDFRTSATGDATLACWARERFLELVAMAQQIAPTVVVVVLNIFR
jgi:hypothetical protein